MISDGNKRVAVIGAGKLLPDGSLSHSRNLVELSEP